MRGQASNGPLGEESRCHLMNGSRYPRVKLSMEKRALLKRLIGEQGISISADQPIPRCGSMSSIPLSSAQQRMWFLDQLAPGGATYNISSLLRLEGSLNTRALSQTFNEIARRHETLRAVFDLIGDRPMQTISRDHFVPLPMVDLTALREGERQRYARQLAVNEAQRHFDLSTGPLLRIRLLVLNPVEHFCVLVMHHIISDGWSVGVLMRELISLYESFGAGRQSQLDELPIQYSDFAIWQNERLQGEALQPLLEYWKRQMAGVPAALELPADRARPAIPTQSGARCVFHLDARLTEELVHLSRKENATLFMTLLTGFQALLYRYTEQHDLCIGAPLAGRRLETEPLIGCFVNTVVLRTDLADNPSYRNLLARVRQTSLDAFAHADLPYERLVEDLHPQRALSHNPFFQVMFVLRNAPVPAFRLPGLNVSADDLDNGTAKFDLTLFLTETNQELKGSLEYNLDLFDPERMGRLVKHYEQVLKEMISRFDQTIGQTNLITEWEWQQVLIEWNDTAGGEADNQCLHHLIQAQVKRTPDAVAVIDENEHLTFHELSGRAGHLARRLKSLGVGPETCVGVYLPRSLAVVIGLLGVLQAGGAYVPLDPNYPRERIDFMMADSQAVLLLTERSVVLPALAASAPTVCLDDELKEAAGGIHDSVCGDLQQENIAYVIYTSGSTGKPKGTAIEHRQVIAFLKWAKDVFPLEDRIGMLASTSICFDLSIFELFLPLSYGGTIILAQTGLSLPRLQGADSVTLLNTVPSVLAELLKTGDLPPSVRTVNVAGEPLKSQLVRQTYAQDTVMRLFNLYGPSEDTTYSTFTLLKKGTIESPSIGRPIAETRVYLLDHHGQPVPLGVTGEVHLSGSGVTRGYLNRAELTAEKFVPDHLTEVPGTRLYRTGDLARWRANGEIEFLGRGDNQVKLRGFRIELGEIEVVLSAHPEVQEVVVVAQENRLGDRVLAAYIVGQRNHHLTAQILRDFLSEKLPAYLTPAVFVFLDRLPLTLNGKVDKRRLSFVEESSERSPINYVAPQTEVELRISEVWQSILQVEKVGLHDNFFDLGGHSLLLLAAYSRLRSSLSRDLAVVELFRYPTVASLAGFLTAQSEAETVTSRPSFDRGQSRRDALQRQKNLRSRQRASKKSGEFRHE